MESTRSRKAKKKAYLSGRATTNPPSAVTITPADPASPGPSTVVKKLLGIPVVRLIRGRSSYARSSLVGHS